MRLLVALLMGAALVGCGQGDDSDVPDAEPVEPGKAAPGGGAHPVRRGAEEPGG